MNWHLFTYVRTNEPALEFRGTNLKRERLQSVEFARNFWWEHRATVLSVDGHLVESLSIYPSIYLTIHVCSFLSIYLSIHPSIYLSIHLSIFPSLYTSHNPSIHSFIYVSIYSSIYLSIYSTIHPCICLSIYPSIYLSIYLSFDLSIFSSDFLYIKKNSATVSNVDGQLVKVAISNVDGQLVWSTWPRTLDPQPSTLNPQPSTLNLKSTTLKPIPSTPNP